jgi:flagellar biosynthesis component FlhA
LLCGKRRRITALCCAESHAKGETGLIDKNKIKEAADAGYIIADALCIIMTNLKFLIKENISEIFTYDTLMHLLKKAGKMNPFLIEYCFSKYKPIELKEILHMMLEQKKTCWILIK